MKSLLKVSLAALTLAFAVSSHAADKKLVVATDTAFVPFEFKQATSTSVLMLICGTLSRKN